MASLEETLRALLEEGHTPGAIYNALLEVAPERHRATEVEINTATELYVTDGIEIDEPAMASRSDDGVWVHAWLLVPYEELEQQ